jgi:hypothetical protein
MFKVGDKTTLNEDHIGFIGYDTVWEIVGTKTVGKVSYYIVKKLTEPNTGNEY